jgi:glycosyltransferase involved in cell wall biosynthesis
MKITEVVPSLEERQGGPSRSVAALARALAEAGHDTELLATEPGPGRETVEGRLRVRVFRRGWPSQVCPSAGLRAALRAGAPEIVHHHALWLRTLHYAHGAARRHGAVFVISPRGMMAAWAWSRRAWRKKLASQLIHPGALTDADGWHATSPEEAEEIRALGFTQPVCVAPNGVELPTVPDLAHAATHWHAVCPAVAKRPVALFYSRFHAKKRVLELIDVWLAHAPRDWLLLLVGIPQEYTPEALNAYVMRASGAGRVQAFTGLGQPPPYAVASLFLLPSHNENFGLVIAEAMAHGVPALVTDTTPWRALNTGERGWCVPWGEFPAALRAATAEGATALHARGARAQAWVVREYSWTKSAQALADFYAQLRAART